MNQALMTMLPAEVRTALEGGAAPEDLMQSMLMARMQAAQEVLDSDDVIEAEDPWPELGWDDGYELTRSRSPDSQFEAEPELEPEPLPPVIYRLADVARALGACPVCLGDSSDCPACAGAGSPGWTVPEPELFEAMVVPALRRLQSEALRRAQELSTQFPGPDGSNRNGHSHSDRNGDSHNNQEDGNAR